MHTGGTVLTSRRQRGITLIEMIAAIVILAIALVGITAALSGGIGRSADVMTQTRAVSLAQSYLEEITGRRYDERSNPRGVPPCRNNCTDEPDFGPDGGENDRPDYDDVDDYHGLDEGWNTGRSLQDPLGNTRHGYDSFRVQVSVRYINTGPGGQEASLGQELTDERDAKLVTVTVSHPDAPAGWHFSAYRANF